MNQFAVTAGMNAICCPTCAAERAASSDNRRQKGPPKSCGTVMVNLSLDGLAKLRLAGQYRAVGRCEGVPFNGKINHTVSFMVYPTGLTTAV